MNSSIDQLLKVQEVDSEMILLRESLRMRPREIEDDRKKSQDTRQALEALVAKIKQFRMESDRREVDVKKCDAEIEKYNVAMNQAKSNQEYTIIKEQIKRQEDLRAKAEEEVIEKLTQIDAVEAERKATASRLVTEEKGLQKKTAEVDEMVRGMQKQLGILEEQKATLLVGVDRDHMRIYERVLARHNNFALARVEDQVCHGCYIAVTAQDVNLLMQGQFVQCRSCSRILYLPG